MNDMNIHVKNIGECQKCSEMLATYLSDDQFRFSGKIIDDPKRCDALVILGVLCRPQLDPLMEFYKDMPRKHAVISFGNCGTNSQDLFDVKEKDLKNKAIVKQDLAEVIPIDYIIEGCPPTLESIHEVFQEVRKRF